MTGYTAVWVSVNFPYDFCLHQDHAGLLTYFFNTFLTAKTSFFLGYSFSDFFRNFTKRNL